MIRLLNPESQIQLQSEQVILDISQAVKELLENSIDAGATQITIQLEREGRDKLTLSDNGQGIPKASFPHLFKQAIHALSQLGEILVTTKTAEDGLASSLSIVKEEIVVQSASRDIGTTVVVQNLFYKKPVRQKDLQQNVKSYYNKIISLVKEYGLIQKGIQFILMNDSKMVINSGTINSFEHKISLLLGPKYEEQLQKIHLQKEEFCIEGFILKTVNSGSGSNNVFLKKNEFYFYINSKPINPLKKLVLILDNIFKQYDQRSKNFAIVNLVLDPNLVDFNLSKDKRDVSLANETIIQTDFHSYLVQLVESNNTQIRQISQNPKESHKILKKDEQIIKQETPQKSQRQSQSSQNSQQKNQQNHQNQQNHLKKQDTQFEEELPPLDEDLEPMDNFEKEMFSSLEILGQFNLGFIVTRYQDRLFIIDQHAANEKFNYERFLREMTIQYQQCIFPKKLPLTDLEKIIIEENQSIFQKNGFYIKDGLLQKIPFIEKYELTEDDLYDILRQIQDNVDADKIRPKKVMQIFAYKACRKSYKVGDPLDKNTQQKVVRSLAGLDSPWNCPHGRPTMIKTPQLNTVLGRIQILPRKRTVQYNLE